MLTVEGQTMASVMNSLSESLRGVPPAAVPAVLDCIIASTGLSSSSLFDYLLNAFTNITRDTIGKDEKLDMDQCDYLTSLVGGLCYLLKQIGVDPDALKSFIWRSFVPFVIIIPAVDRKMLLQIVEYFIGVVIETNMWKVVEETLVPYLLRSAVLSMNLLPLEKLKPFVMDKFSSFRLSSGLITEYAIDQKQENGYGYCPLPVACHILTAMLDSSIHIELSEQASDLAERSDSKVFASIMIWELCHLSEQLLSQSSDHRSCAINFLLPTIFKAFYSHCLLEISINGQTCKPSRSCFLKKIWKCCKTLFPSGLLERRDAYSILTLYLSFFPHSKEREDDEMCDTVDKFDLTAEKDFWDEVKGGLIDKEGLVRKQSLYVLKKILCLNDDSHKHDIQESGKQLNACGMTKRERWANKEAKSLGVDEICRQIHVVTDSHPHWQAFVLLYEMLEEYGTHLIEAAWNHQVSLFFQISVEQVNPSNSVVGIHRNHIKTSGEIFSWLSILWERGFHHDNPLVRCLIMQSFLDIKWEDHGHLAGSLPETFVLGPFILALNDPVHHKDFGVRGVYSSETIKGASRFCYQYANCIDKRKRMGFLLNVVSATHRHLFSRAGLMGLVECIASAALTVEGHNKIETKCVEDDFVDNVEVDSHSETYYHNHNTELLDALRFVMETSKQHFNPNYRLQVCDKILEAASSVLCTFDVPLDLLMNFISTLPREFTDCGGALRVKVQEWIGGCNKKHCTGSCCSSEINFWRRIHDFPKKFLLPKPLVDGSTTYDDEELKAWDFEAKRWARLLFLVVEEDHHITPIMTFIQNHGVNISMQNNNTEWMPMKFLILNLSMVQELQLIQERAAEVGIMAGTQPEFGLCEMRNSWKYTEDAISYEKFVDSFLSMLEELVTFASNCCSIFWSGNGIVADTTLPSSVKGKLGGPSQRRLPSSIATPVLLAITALKTVTSILSWITRYNQYNSGSTNQAFIFLWKFFLKTISLPLSYSEIGAEICLAAYEASCYILPVVASVFPARDMDFNKEGNLFLRANAEGKPQLDTVLMTFLQHINSLLAVGFLARSRQAVLLNWKWLCLESLFSIPYQASQDGHSSVVSNASISNATLRWIFSDLVENLENAGEGSVLPMLRLVRQALRLFSSGKEGVLVSSCNGLDSEMMWNLVRSSWILHVSCNKRRVAHIAALLSSILHSSVFCDKEMHLKNSTQGPLKWFVEKILEEGTKSPRTFRLAALHLCGMWLTYPWTVPYYLTEMKLLSLYGSAAFDEDFEAELADYQTRSEVSLLAKIPDIELTEAFSNTELYARVSVAVLFSKLADLSDRLGSENENEDCYAALRCGRMFLLQLLESAVKDNDLSKDLYKKYSAIHRRKVRVWQMICVLSRFVGEDIIPQVIDSLHICLCRNNLPAVRQYLETFAINLYLKFPFMVGKQLVPILQDYKMKPQALSSYVFIAANIILNASEAVQTQHLNELLPPIVPQLTSHHHSLRGFTQLLVYQVLDKIYPKLEYRATDMALEKRCFENLKTYLEKNSDCVRLRASMIGYLDAYNPISSITPAGIFMGRVDELKFECVPTCLMEQVLIFLNNVREDLRSSMAKDDVSIKNESFRSSEDSSCMKTRSAANKEKLVVAPEMMLDFQKKLTVFKHEKQDSADSSIFGNKEIYRHLLEMEKDDELLHQLLMSRSLSMEGLRASRQEFVLVASLVDRIPNLAGLARTCEVFKAAGLVVADLNILCDKQFQLISVTAEKWVPTIEVPVNSLKAFLEKKKREGFSILGLEQTANSVSLDQFIFPKKTVLVLGREKEGIPVDIIHILDTCIEIPQLGVVRSLNVHVSGAIALWEYTRQQRCH